MPRETPNPNPKEHQATGSKRKRNLPGTPDPDAEVVSLSPKTLLSATTFVCEVCGKEFRRDQNLQIHRRGHNLPWKHSPKSSPSASAAAKKRVYVCPEVTCVYHEPSRALGDLTGIKKHYSRKHGEKKWECDKCSKKYAVRTDWKAHSRICGNREYECLPCGTLFSKKESFLIHKTSCEASASASAAEEEATDGEEEDSRRTRTIDFGVKANTVNNELMFPSLWGKVSEPPKSATRGGGEETQSK